MKIAIVGQSGGGKTTLGKFLARQYAEPFLEADALLEQRGFFRKRNKEEQSRILSEVTQEIRDFSRNSGWVIDNNHQPLRRKQVVRDADQVVYFDFSLYERVIGNLRRHLRGEKRIYRFWTHHLPRAIRHHRSRRREILAELESVRPKVTTIRSRAELARYKNQVQAT